MKKTLTTLLILIVSISLVACGGGSAPAPAAPAESAPEAAPAAPANDAPAAPAEGGQWKAGFITQAMSNESQAFSWREFQRLAPEYGFTMNMWSGETGPQDEVAGIEQAIAEGYDAIFVNPSSIESIIPALMQAKEAGLIVGMFSSELPEEHQNLRDFFCGSDDFQGGQQAGEFVVTHFPDGASFVEVGGQAGHDAQIKRHDGFRAGIAGSNIVELDSQNVPGPWPTNEAMAIMEDFLVRHGDAINIVFCHWDNGASGVIEAIENSGRKANADDGIFVIGVDGNRTGYAQVRAGTQALSVGQSFTNMAKQSLENAKTMLEGGTVPAVNFIPLDMVTLGSIDSFVEPDW
ncbi:MAG: sugar ABC transporter substrate-binding protein [Oscillospiraceae bacterium]|nr:sugar ABC transporter substrate-binding protein [Oscillospiraceae bacterium]